ncbi:hypothetical protein [Ureibacillus acetophenoni]|uniref:Carbohydrate binding protein n=1 Tax=Ureibacillus acetophenoni TaxID=614649 RepID=A0A285USX3_9BACL|nr:hypothetical protein [Ureibacillus acetophenoni]SOC44954.1 hypothetical protein SAMN05877842_1262 [Ureibacillus acetophenoni]
MKIKNKLKSVVLSVTLIASLGLSTNAQASEITPMAIDLNGYEYIHNWGTTGQEVTWQHEATNPSGITSAVTRSVSREKYSSGTYSANATFKGMQWEVGVSAEVSDGESITETTSVTWNIPPNSTYLLRFGSKFGQASGTEKYWSNGIVLRSKTVSGKWTYMSFHDSIPIR